MQSWLKGQSHILKTAIMVPRRRLSRAIAAIQQEKNKGGRLSGSTVLTHYVFFLAISIPTPPPSFCFLFFLSICIL